MLYDVPPSHLKAFLLTSKSRSFSDAAERLGVTQSAVSQIVNRLEEKLELQLFDRRKRPYQLTEAGRLLSVAVPTLLEQLDYIESSLMKLREGKPSVLRLGISKVASDVFGESLETALIPQLSSLEVVSGLIPMIQEQFKKGAVDIAVVPEIDFSEGMFGYLLTEEDYFIVTPSSATGGKNHISQEELRKNLNLPFVSYRQQSLDRKRSQMLLRQLKMPSSILYELENTRAVVRAKC